MKPTMLRPRDVAEMLGLTVQTVYQMFGQGRIPHVRIGRRLFIPVDAWEAWIAEQNRRAQECGIAEPYDKGKEVINNADQID